MSDSLKGLQEIPLPAPVAYVPQTAGWLVVAIVLLATVAVAAWRWRRRWLVNRYRRAAMIELATIERGLATGEGTATALPALVKRTALAFAPREMVARLGDAEWLAFLDRTFPPGGFATGPGRLLPTLAYAPAREIDANAQRDLVALVRRWIDGHHAGV